MSWYIKVLKQYADFNGRARRQEYWMFVLFNFIIAMVLGLAEAMVRDIPMGGTSLLSSLYSLAVLLPSLAVGARRLHDTGRSGWWLLIGLLPCIGWIVLLVFAVQDSQPGQNLYGSNPKDGS